MGSADIRKLIKTPRIPDNSISGVPPEDNAIPPARERLARLIQNLNDYLADKSIRERQRVLSAHDLYTKRAKLSQNVHYLDKKTDRTLFIDTGKAIAVRKSAMTASAVEIVLALAKEKFCSTLAIKGSQAFKDQIVEVVAQKNLDIHFTDKAMNQQLEARKAELEIERGGKRIEEPENVTTDRAEGEKLAEATTTAHGQEEKPAVASDAHSSAPQPGAEKAQKGVHQGVLLEHGAAPYKFKPDMNKPEDRRDDSYFVTLQTADGKTRTLWGVDLENAVSRLHQGEQVKFEDKGIKPVTWTEIQEDGSTVEKTGQRRTWEGTPLEREQQQSRDVAGQHTENDYDGPDVA